MSRNYPQNPLMQPVKGVFVAKPDTDIEKTCQLLRNLRCNVLSSGKNRFMVTTNRGNLEQIKQSWLSPSANNALSKELKARIERIIIGGNSQHN